MKKLINIFTLLGILLFSVSITIFNCSSPEPEIMENKLEQLLPKDNEILGWRKLEEPRFFQADNLWEYINGAADGYLTFGFQEVVTVEFANEDESQHILVDIYEMKDQTNGFGIYSMERAPDNNFVPVGSQGFISESSLNFWKEKYYIKLITYESSPGISEILTQMGNSIAEKISGNAQMPAFLDYFPKEGLKSNSEKYIASDVMGQSFLHNGYTAEYSIGGEDVKVFLIDCPNNEAAQSSYLKYKDYIKMSGQVVNDISGISDDAFIGEDNYYGTIVVFRQSSFMGGILGVKDSNTGQEFIKKLVSKISS